MYGGFINYAMRYAAFSLGVQPTYSAMVSNCCRNTAHEVDPSNLGVPTGLFQGFRYLRFELAHMSFKSLEQIVYNF
jgi:hypothetical protein